MLGFSAAVAPFRASTSRLVQGGATRSTRRMTEGGHTNLAAATDAGARSAVTAIAVILGLASGSTILTSPPTHDTGSSRCCKEDSTARSIGIVESNVQRLRFWVVDFIVLPSCRHRLTLLPSLNRVQCDDSSGRHYADAADQGYDDESGYTEAERFWGCIDYHRSLLHDYNRRWGPGIPVLEATDSSSSDGETITTRNDTVANLSAQWPRTIPTTTELSALECDLRYCERSPNYVNHIGICQDVKFRIASYYTTQNDEESQRLGFRTVKELAEQGHPDAMCYYGILLNEGKIPGVDANPQQAVVWWRRCYDDHRHIKATYELATAYYLGEGVPENPELAVGLFRRAAHLGHAGAAYMLGECLLNGVGLVRDRADALEWLVTAAELGHRGARDRVITVLNEDYSNLDAGKAAEERKEEEAVKWMNLQDEAKLKAVNIERRYTIGGGSRNPAVRARRKTIVAESRDESSSF